MARPVLYDREGPVTTKMADMNDGILFFATSCACQAMALSSTQGGHCSAVPMLTSVHRIIAPSWTGPRLRSARRISQSQPPSHDRLSSLGAELRDKIKFLKPECVHAAANRLRVGDLSRSQVGPSC